MDDLEQSLYLLRVGLTGGVSGKGPDASLFQYNVTYFLDNAIDNKSYLSLDDASNDLTKRSHVGKLPGNDLHKLNTA